MSLWHNHAMACSSFLCVFSIMGILFGKLNNTTTNPQNTPTDTPDPSRTLTSQEKEHLILLSTTAGSPGIMMEAIQSGNIFYPRHMERAQGLNKQWEDAATLFAPYFEKQKLIEAERE